MEKRMKRSLFIPLLLLLLVGTLVGGVFTWQHAALFTLMRWPWASGVSSNAYLYYALKLPDGFVLARAPKGADGQPLAQPQTLLPIGDGFGLLPSDSISSIQLSPDGNYLAIDGIHGDDEQVWMYNTQNSSVSFSPTSVSGNFLHWIPGGNGHTFLYRPMLPAGADAPMDGGIWNPGLWLVDASTDTHQNIDIGESSADLIDAVSSPDGRRIVYSTTSGLGMGSTTFVMNRDGSARTQLFSLKNTQQAVAGLFTWSPDGTRIAYERMADSATPFLAAGLWTMNIQGEQQQHVADADGGHGYMPVWSPNSKKLAFVERTNNNDPHADNNDQALQSAICVVDLATLQVQQLASKEQTNLPININPVWVAHGTRVTFTALNPVNRDLGSTQHYWSAMVTPSTKLDEQKQARIASLSPGILHVIAAG
jgi:dipeptidyl aminopeptidase/acylaminoacyl peptidase